jgi:myosin heavy subunit
MINMDIINDAELLNNLSLRFKRDLIFTWVGPTLLVVNPFAAVPHLVNTKAKFDYIGKIAVNKGMSYIYIYKLKHKVITKT